MPEKQQETAKGRGFKTQTEFLASGFGLVQTWLLQPLENEPADCLTACLYLSVALTVLNLQQEKRLNVHQRAGQGHRSEGTSDINAVLRYRASRG